jgi:hypothetical protein
MLLAIVDPTSDTVIIWLVEVVQRTAPRVWLGWFHHTLQVLCVFLISLSAKRSPGSHLAVTIFGLDDRTSLPRGTD